MGIMTSHGAGTGLPVIDEATCSVCGLCVEACPVGVLSRGSGRIAVDPDAGFGCIACGHCMMICPGGSIAVRGRGLAPDDLMDLPAEEGRCGIAPLEGLFRARRSIRRFRDEPVPGDALDRIIAAASTAPMGIPPWEVGVLAFRGRAAIRALAEDTARGYAGLLKVVDRRPARFLLRLLLKRDTFHRLDSFLLPLGRDIVQAHREGRDLVLYDAPAVLLFSHSGHAEAADAVIACTYAMLAAEALGLGTCMIGCLPPILARRKDLMRRHGVPAGQTPAIALILGYPALSYARAVQRCFLTTGTR